MHKANRESVDESAATGLESGVRPRPAQLGAWAPDAVRGSRRILARLTTAAALLAIGGCAQRKPLAEPVRIPNVSLGRASVAVAPAINLSGSTDFDPSRVADLMAVELSYADDVSVIPVSRVLGVLAAQGKDRIESPAHALEVLQWLGADAMLVFAVTEYVPFEPPRVGLSAQVYADVGHPKVESQTADEQGIQHGASAESAVRVVAEARRVFDASQNAVVAEIQQFAVNRTGDESPYGWRRYVVSQEGFLRFCCHETVAELLSARQTPVTIRIAAGK
jgi:hypothetical protein